MDVCSARRRGGAGGRAGACRACGRRLLSIAPWLAVLLLGRGAWAQPEEAPPAIAAHVPADAAALLAFRLPEVEDGFAFADLLSGLYPQLARVVSELRAPLALPAMSESALADRGIAGDEATFASLGRRLGGPAKRLEGLAHRLVVPVSDLQRFLPYAASVLERAGFTTHRPERKTKTPAWAKPLGGLVKKHKVLLAGLALDTGTAAVLRWERRDEGSAGFALIDVFMPAAPPPKPQRRPSLAPAVASLLDVEDVVPLARVWQEGTRRRLATPASFVLVLQPAHLALTLPPACRARFAVDAGAFFSDAALTARLHPFDWKLRLAFAPTPAAAASLRLTGHNDGLIDARALAHAGLAAGILYSDAADTWAKLPRPASVGATWAETTRQWQACGPAAAAITFANAWPHLIVALFQEALEPLGSPGWLKDARNLALGIRSPFATGDTPQPPSAIWMASFEDARHDELARWLADHSQGAPEQAEIGGRAPTLFSLPAASVRSAGLEKLPGPRCGLALSPAEAGLGWYYSQKRRPAVFGKRGALGSLHINVGRMLNLAAEDAETGTRDAVALATSQLSMLGGDLVVEGDLLELDLSFASDGI